MMVIGNGVIANRFIDYSLQSNYLIFAGSVNDSAIVDGITIQAEEAAILAALSESSDITFVYFSSCSIIDPDVSHTPYVQHKVRMEKLIQNKAKKFVIFRLPQVLGLSDAKSGLANYLVDAIFNQKPFELWQHAQKNLIDIDDIHEIVGEILRRELCLNKIINVASTHQTSALELVQCIEIFSGVSSNYTLIGKGTSYELDVSDIQPIIRDLKIDFSEHYIRSSLNKYFGHLKQRPKLLSIVVPTYNEEHGIEEFYRRTKNVLERLSPRFEHEMIFINDFSTDKTFAKLQLIAETDQTVKLINVSRNFGNQIGITAGIDFANGDIAVVIDDDLQDPPEIIPNLIAQWDKGYKVVYGVRPI